MKKLKCKVCETEFIPTAEDHYVTCKQNILVVTYYDTFDCPQCGCQIIAGVREQSQNDYLEELKFRLADEPEDKE